MSINEMGGDSTTLSPPNQNLFFNSVLSGNLISMDTAFSLEAEDILENGRFNLNEVTENTEFTDHMHIKEN
jgi:hypothetical protein